LKSIEETEHSGAQAAYDNMQVSKRASYRESDASHKLDNTFIFGKGLSEDDTTIKTAGEQISEMKKDINKVKDRSWEVPSKSKSITDAFSDRLNVVSDI
jgi:hypothetical protein